jgi:hypothetical protein
MEIPQYNLNTILQDYFRLIACGASDSGKTYFITKKLFPILVKKYKVFIVITPGYNGTVYKKALSNYVHPSCVKCVDSTKFESSKDLEATLVNIQKMIEKTKIGKNEDGHDVYRWNTCLILDDVLSEKNSRSEAMSNLFMRFRHYQCSIIFTSNYTNIVLTPLMLANSTHLALFQLAGKGRNDCLHLLMQRINYKTESKGKDVASQIYKKYIDDRHTDTSRGSLLIDQTNSKLYYN